MMKIPHGSGPFGGAVVAAPAPRPGLLRVTQRASRIIGTWMERSRQRRALAHLDDRLLKDIGLTRSEAEREIYTPFWR